MDDEQSNGKVALGDRYVVFMEDDEGLLDKEGHE